LKFKNRRNSFEHHFFLVIDFETFLKPVDQNFDADTKTRVVDEHQVSGFCCHRVTDLQQYQTQPTVYSGPNVMERFYEHLMSESNAINEILCRQLPLLSMSQVEIDRYRASTECGNCRSQFTHENYKVRHHDHTTGEFLFSCCRQSNLQLKPKKRRGYQLPVIAHNSVGYDLHYIIKHYKKRYDDNDGRKSGSDDDDDDVTIIPLNGERFLQVTIGNVKFLDSFHFLPTSLDNLVALLLKAGNKKFP